ncbi:HlyD family efflux transporter periplasmic adaptor subunit [Aromatoleum aromaticum]|uniref:Multidrug resistance protein n=1 Tax=Aromatoleum aromaticum (strain DSM 19018 / LMG 30748 / EbN1) TaxID=76114 RepID=Q5P3P4_AROAE|nr:HlyD family efflux transporter periplasmic adaptor subunit [Aromatoleum aromaticum]NMG54378.1 HlyD family efflux transporter periplasmic adaptor subunit [Aromatoleum aromaticum]CAI08070.1 putative multidrug resistance protein [Aromatoleum aromaticum EbN1]
MDKQDHTPAPAQTSNPARKRALLGLTALFSVIGLAYGGYWYGVERFRVETDNAYVQGNVVQITPQVAGTVLAINADDTDYVEAGQSLVRLDPADAQVALDQAEAQLAQTVREVRTTYANNSTLTANIAMRQAELARVQADVARAEDDVARRRPLVATGAVGKEELQHAVTALANARAAGAAATAALAAAREQLTSNQSLTEGTTVENHPNVQKAAARVREAYLALKRSDLPAPVTGYVAKRSAQVGQRVQAGAPLMAIIPLEQVWVDANFKESQLQDMRIGQPVRLAADMYGKKVEYHGTVAGLGAGTGAVFSLLPAQNATGNWIKVVQRVPVRVALDARELTEHPLRVGLSMTATVDVHDQSGKALADAPRHRPVAQTPVYGGLEADADAAVSAIVATHLGRKAAPVARPAAQAPASDAAVAKKPLHVAAAR